MELLFKAKTQEEFLKAAFDFYRTRCVTEYTSRKVGHAVIEQMYRVGRDYQTLNMDFEQFKNIVIGTHSSYYYGRRYKRRGYGGHYSHFCAPEYYRVLRSYTNSGHKKKNSPSKKDWWEYKGFMKDRRKYNNSHHWKKSLKESCKRKHRQFEREHLAAERYDSFHNRTYKNAEDPWRWD